MRSCQAKPLCWLDLRDVGSPKRRFSNCLSIRKLLTKLHHLDSYGFAHNVPLLSATCNACPGGQEYSASTHVQPGLCTRARWA